MKVASTALGPDCGLVVDCGNFKAESVECCFWQNRKAFFCYMKKLC